LSLTLSFALSLSLSLSLSFFHVLGYGCPWYFGRCFHPGAGGIAPPAWLEKGSYFLRDILFEPVLRGQTSPWDLLYKE